MIKNWNGQRKDRNDMMDLLWIIGGVIVCGACVGGYLVYRKNSRLRQQEEADEQRRADAERQRRAAQKKAEAERAARVDEYCRVMQKLDGYQDREVYRRSFLEVGPFLQLLLGSERSSRLYGDKAASILLSLKVAAQNQGMWEKFAGGKLQVKEYQSAYDEEQLRQDCEKADNAAILLEIQKGKKQLIERGKHLDCKKILQQSAPAIYQALQAISADNLRECFAHAGEIERILMENGCYAIYADDKRVAQSESMRVDFREDSSFAIELPGLYTKGKDGTYDLVGTMGGTMRGGKR